MGLFGIDEYCLDMHAFEIPMSMLLNLISKWSNKSADSLPKQRDQICSLHYFFVQNWMKNITDHAVVWSIQ